MKVHTVWAVRTYTPDEPELVTAILKAFEPVVIQAEVDTAVD